MGLNRIQAATSGIANSYVVGGKSISSRVGSKRFVSICHNHQTRSVSIQSIG